MRIISLLRLFCIQILNDLSHCKGASDVKIIKNGLTYDASAALSSVVETNSVTQGHNHAFSYIRLSVIRKSWIPSFKMAEAHIFSRAFFSLNHVSLM